MNNAKTNGGLSINNSSLNKGSHKKVLKSKMKKLKVYLQYPLGRSECSYYKYLVTETPEEYEYANKEKSKGIIESKNKKFLVDILKKYGRKFIRTFIPFLPNAHYTKNAEKYDLIHCAHCLSKNKQPWVCDIEFVGQFWATGPYRDFPSKKQILKYLESPYCKKILAWTEWAKEGIVKEFPEIKDKVEVVYPGIPVQKIKKKEHKKINLLFVSRKFYFKGGLYVLEIMDKLTKKYNNVYGTIISDALKDIIKNIPIIKK
ncbi:MAG: hypothetical protein CVU81_00885 [Euryarchaeota archaeon HGW-Euryarchaeota-1]|nr:MAG: hypothetical protein CVU81_00885 [Euryarchaeota archaeon HGW-Euryarchaeota-1]